MSISEPQAAVTRRYSTDDQRWQAVVRRDRRADDVFFYSVRTTGVFCRPSCAARQARRENVRFHDTTTAAEAAGFRACQRCRPNNTSLAAQRGDLVAQACRLIEEADEAPHLEMLANAVGLSPSHFHRVFKTATGVTPKQYANARRAQRTREEFSKTATVTAAIYRAGFNSNGPFYATSSRALGMTPTTFRAGGAGMVIRFAVGECWLGSILVAASPIGICSIALGDDPHALVEDLQDRFSKAELIGGDHDFEMLVARVIGFVERPSAGLDLPLDVQGTAFQQRVWQKLCEIPYGETTSYGELAQRVGEPMAVRAVASACGANPIAVAIPCHRVVRSDGSLSGYRWGIERKAKLLDRERESRVASNAFESRAARSPAKCRAQ